MRNPHRLLSVFTPDRDVQAKKDAAFAEKMNTERSHFSNCCAAGASFVMRVSLTPPSLPSSMSR